MGSFRSGAVLVHGQPRGQRRAQPLYLVPRAARPRDSIMTLRLKVGMHFSCLVHPFSELNHVNLVTNHPLKKKSARRGYKGIDVQWTLAVHSRAVFFFNVNY